MASILGSIASLTSSIGSTAPSGSGSLLSSPQSALTDLSSALLSPIAPIATALPTASDLLGVLPLASTPIVSPSTTQPTLQVLSTAIQGANASLSTVLGAVPQALSQVMETFLASTDALASLKNLSAIQLDSLVPLGISATDAAKLTGYTAGLLSQLASGAGLIDTGNRQLAKEQPVGIDLVASKVSPALLDLLGSIGLKNIAHEGNLISGAIPITAITSLLKLADIQAINVVDYTFHANTGTVSGAEAALKTTTVNNSGFTGNGVKVGVISDSYNTKGGAQADLASGDLGNVTVLSEAPANSGSDEGRAMMQIIRDEAPNVQLLFHTVLDGGTVNFTNKIKDMAAKGAKIIVDDLAISTQLTFANDLVGKTIDQVTAQGVIYVTANGNDSVSGVIKQNAFVRDVNGIKYLDMNNGTSAVDPIYFQAGADTSARIRLTWGDKAPSIHGGTAATNLDFDIFDLGTTQAPLANPVLVVSGNDNQLAGGFDPIEYETFNVVNGHNYAIVVRLTGGITPEFIQINKVDSAIGFYKTNIANDEVSSVYGTALNESAISVGAVDYRKTAAYSGTPESEIYSSYGNAFLTHDAAGNKLATFGYRKGAEIAGVDGLNNTFFGADVDNTGKPNFFGTSAAAPSIAGVLALMVQKNPALTKAQALSALAQSGVAVKLPSNAGVTEADKVAGFGLAQADVAISNVTAAGGPDTTAPTVTSFSPSDEATNVGIAQNIVLTFSENVVKGTGNLVLKNGSTVVETFNVATATNISISGATVTINPTADFALSKAYNLDIPAGAFKDSAGNAYSGTSTYNFTTQSSNSATPGNDTLTGTANADTIDALAGNDLVDGLAGNDTLKGGDGNDTLNGGEGIDLLNGGTGDDRLDGGAGFDIADYAGATSGVRVSLAITTAQNTLGAGTDTLVSIEGVYGSSFDDTLIGDNNQNALDGAAGNDLLQAGAGDDLIAGGEGNDTLDGGAGADTMYGGAGNDTYFIDNPADQAIESTPGSAGGIDTVRVLSGNYTLGDNIEYAVAQGSGAINLTGNTLDNLLVAGTGKNAFDGGAGTDTVSYISSPNGVVANLAATGAAQNPSGSNGDTYVSIENLLGSNFDDTLIGDLNDNYLNGFNGNNVLVGGAGADFFRAGTGNDTIDGGSDLQTGYLSTSRLDTVDYSLSTAAVTVRLADPNSTSPNGSATGANIGTDTLRNIEGVFGGAGADSITGTNRAGIEIFRGGLGNDTIDGSAGTGVDQGLNFASYEQASGPVTVHLLNGTASGADGNDTLRNIQGVVGSDFADSIVGSAGNDYLIGNAGNDTIDGGAGTLNIVSYEQAIGSVTVLLNQNKSRGADGEDVLTNLQGVIGSRFADTIVGTTGNNAIVSLGGNDLIYGIEGNDFIDSGDGRDQVYGGVGNDVLLGGADDDQLFGEDGDDTLVGGAGADTLDGGAGIDIVDYTSANGSITVNFLDKYATDGLGGRDTLANIENAILSRFNDTFIGDSNANVAAGGDGNDLMRARGGNDTVYGQAGNDMIDGGGGNDYIDGGDGFDTVAFDGSGAAVTVNLSTGQATGDGTDTLVSIEAILGSRFDDTLIGSAQNNRIQGGDGNDTLTGGGGADGLEGGNGADRFIYKTLSDSAAGTDTRDVIADFVSGQDKIDLSEIDAKSSTPTNDAFTFIGSTSFSNVAGQLRFSGGVVQADVNGDGVADLEIVLTGVTTVQASDFVL